MLSDVLRGGDTSHQHTLEPMSDTCGHSVHTMSGGFMDDPTTCDQDGNSTPEGEFQ